MAGLKHQSNFEFVGGPVATVALFLLSFRYVGGLQTKIILTIINQLEIKCQNVPK